VRVLYETAECGPVASATDKDLHTLVTGDNVMAQCMAEPNWQVRVSLLGGLGAGGLGFARKDDIVDTGRVLGDWERYCAMSS
jgi:hypothetical protein